MSDENLLKRAEQAFKFACVPHLVDILEIQDNFPKERLDEILNSVFASGMKFGSLLIEEKINEKFNDS